MIYISENNKKKKKKKKKKNLSIKQYTEMQLDSLIYLSKWTMPEISFAVNKVSKEK